MPGADSIVTALVRERSGSKRRTIRLDGEPWRTTSADAIVLLALSVGDEVADVQTLADRLTGAELEAARSRALRILEYRDRSRRDLARRLLEDGYPEDVASTVATRMEDVGLVDDVRLAEALVAALAFGKSYGRRRIAQELRRRGIPPEVADATLDRDYPAPAEEEQARLAAERLVQTARDERRLAERLVRRGFDWDLARRMSRDVSG